MTERSELMPDQHSMTGTILSLTGNQVGAVRLHD
jgi:hypothetical protein